MVERRFYSDAWFRVEYEMNKLVITFKAWRITKMDYDNVEKSEAERIHCLSGLIKWDGYCEFNYSDSCDDPSMVGQFCLLMEKIYKFKDEHIDTT